jgi:hypothetical protein
LSAATMACGAKTRRMVATTLRKRSITERYSAAAVWHVHPFAFAGGAPSFCGAQPPPPFDFGFPFFARPSHEGAPSRPGPTCTSRESLRSRSPPSSV